MKVLKPKESNSRKNDKSVLKHSYDYVVVLGSFKGAAASTCRERRLLKNSCKLLNLRNGDERTLKLTDLING